MMDTPFYNGVKLRLLGHMRYSGIEPLFSYP